MKLKSIQITNFRCVDDSNEFKVADVTCLVGKNESGKTTILQAIEPLNPHNTAHAEYDRLRDYPRKYLTDYDMRHPNAPATVVRSIWALDTELGPLEALPGEGCLTKRDVEIEKRYAPGAPCKVHLDNRKVLDHLISQAGRTEPEKDDLQKYSSSKTLHDHIATLGDGASDGLKALRAKLASFPDHDTEKAAIDLIRLPKFMDFSNYDRMSGDVSIEQLKKDIV
jgi:energy-coupling factor transporter ATP-binding protein EcfA2